MKTNTENTDEEYKRKRLELKDLSRRNKKTKITPSRKLRVKDRTRKTQWTMMKELMNSKIMEQMKEMEMRNMSISWKYKKRITQ